MMAVSGHGLHEGGSENLVSFPVHSYLSKSDVTGMKVRLKSYG